MKIIISILSAVVVFLAAWNYSLTVKHNRTEQYLIRHVEDYKAFSEDTLAAFGALPWVPATFAEDEERKKELFLFMGSELAALTKDCARWETINDILESQKRMVRSITERFAEQEEMAQNHYNFFSEELLRLNEVLIKTQKQIVRLYETSSR